MTTKSEKELVYAPGGNGAEPVEGQELLPALDDMTPREIVAELDKYIVGQTAAKRAVAVALRNRVRRQKLPPEMAEDVLPKNILMIGPTGVGKTEIARRLARLAAAWPTMYLSSSRTISRGVMSSRAGSSSCSSTGAAPLPPGAYVNSFSDFVAIRVIRVLLSRCSEFTVHSLR